MTSLGTWRLVIPLSELTIARRGPSARPFSKAALISAPFGRASSPPRMPPRPLLGDRPAAARSAPYAAKTSGKNARTTWPKMIGSETFIIVALRWTEKRTPSSLARAIWARRKSSSAATRMTVASTTSPSRTGRASLRTVVVPSAATWRMVRVSSAGRTTERSVDAEVVGAHRRDVGPGVGGPGAHRVRVAARVVLHGGGGPAVGVAFAQNGVHRAALDPVVACPDLLLLVGARLVRVVGQGVALGLQLGDGGLELRHRGRDVRELDDVGLGRLGQLAELGERVADPLLLGEAVGEGGDDPAGERDVTGLHVDAGGAR